MTRNPKPNELPQSIEDLSPMTAPLTIDRYLSRAGVLTRLVDATGIDADPSDGHLGHGEMAALYRNQAPDENRDVETVERMMPKYELIERLGVMFDFPTEPDQDELIKTQLIHLLVTVVTGHRPDPFNIPSDPAPTAKPGGRYQQMTPTAVLGD